MSNNIFKIENGVLVDVLDKTITEAVIPNDVTTIGYEAFEGCTSLISVTIPYGVNIICTFAFYGCTSLTNISIPDSVMWIGLGAFLNCVSLKSKVANYKAFDLKNFRTVNLFETTHSHYYYTNLFETFNHHYGELDKDIAIYECEVGDKVVKKVDKTETSKCCTNKIKPVKRLYREDVIKLLNV